MDLVITIYLVIGLILSFPVLFTREDVNKYPVKTVLLCIFLWPVVLAVLIVNILTEDD